MQKKPVFYRSPNARGGLTAAVLLAAGLLFCAPALLSSCANAVNSRGGPVDEGGSSGGGSASDSNSTTRNGRGGLVPEQETAARHPVRLPVQTRPAIPSASA